jgi:hypothetical protein
MLWNKKGGKQGVPLFFQRKTKPPEKAVSFFRPVLSGLLGEILYDHSYTC